MTLSKRIVMEQFFKRIRQSIISNNLALTRLPKWLESANVTFFKIKNTNVILIEDSIKEKDTFQDHGKTNTDLQYYFNAPQVHSRGSSFVLFDDPQCKLIILMGEYGEDKRVIFNVRSANNNLFDIDHHLKYHSPMALFNIFINFEIKSKTFAIKFIPFAFYIHDKDFYNFEIFWEKCYPILYDFFIKIYDSEIGDYYEQLRTKQRAILVNKEKTVLVLGKYRNGEKNKLDGIRDYLISRNYEAYLLEDLPEHPTMSTERKVKSWAVASRFSVMLDLSPSGHIAEFTHIDSVKEILAVLRVKGKRSTYMIGNKCSPDTPYIKIFEFEKTPLEVINDAIKWAENHLKKRKKTFNEYPWRKR